MSASEHPGGGGAVQEREAPATAAVIGGGPAGFAAAEALVAAGSAVTVFDRGRTPGGRCSTRRSRSGVSFDHGSPCFTASSDGFRERVAGWEKAGVLGRWEGRFLRADPGGQRDAAAAAGDPALAEMPAVRWRPDPRERWVGVPSMAAFVEHLTGVCGAGEIHPQAEIVELLGEPTGRGSAGPWILKDAEGGEHGPFDLVVVAVAGPQAARLVEGPAPRLARLAERAKAGGCFAVMLAFDEPLNLAPAAADVADGEEPAAVDGVRLDRGPLSWAHRETNKPGRGEDSSAECWVLHARPTWAASRLEEPPEQVIAPLKAAFERLLGRPLPSTSYEAAHRWKFAHCVKPLPDAAFVSRKHGLAACGDWFGGPGSLGGVEAAMESALACASAFGAVRSEA